MKNIKINLPKSFFYGETKDGYYVTPEMKKVWAVLFDLLEEFRRVCTKYDIKWFGDGGTILGAVRHKGMIPWDDDIDVMMLRSEYDRFCEVAPKEFTHPYFFQTEETDPGSARGHVQIRNSLTTGILTHDKDKNYHFNQGIFLDIFPIETIPDNDIKFKEQVANVERLRQSYFGKRDIKYGRIIPSKKILPLGKRLVKRILVNTRWGKKYDYKPDYVAYQKECVKYEGIESKRLCKLVLTPIKERRIWKRKWFEDTVYLPFESFMLPVPKGYIELLDTFYGN